MDTPDIKKCHKCGATWIEGQLYWATGAAGSNADLAGLVCDQLPIFEAHLCSNELRGTNHGGDTWEKRAAKIDQLDLEMRMETLRLKKELEGDV